MTPRYVTDIVKDVKIILDENDVTTNILSEDQDQIQLDAIIASKIPMAVRDIHMSAPLHMLDGLPLTNAPFTNQDGTGYIILPNDFMRLAILQMTDWITPVTTVIIDTDAEYIKQKSKYAGIRGNRFKPVCALTSSNENKILEFYSVKQGEQAKIKKFTYIPYPQESEGVILVCDKVYDAITYMTAGLTATTIKESNSEALINIAKGQLQ